MSTDVEVDLDLLLETVDQFAANAEHRLFGEESPDGDLDAIGDLLRDAAAIGLLADVDPETGHWGVWGAHADDEGAAFSLAVLRRLGRVCAGLATAVHAQGLGVRLLGASEPAGLPAGLPTGTRLAAAFCPPYGLALDPRTTDDGMRLIGDRLTGTARFALAAGTAEAVVVAAHAPGSGTGADDARAVVCLPSGTPGLRLVPTGRRIGLRAATMLDVVADGVTFTGDVQRYVGGPAADRLRITMAADWLGQAAIALGCAEQAIAVARDYTRSRVQGGVAISEHAAIRLLLSRAEHDAAVVAAVLERHAGTPLAQLDPATLLGWAVDARLAAGEHAGRAVTDALQTLGGYGYMDEYGLSKRLRDVTALRVLHGGPDQLVLARNELGATS
jgi:hypothetical protein